MKKAFVFSAVMILLFSQTAFAGIIFYENFEHTYPEGMWVNWDYTNAYATSNYPVVGNSVAALSYFPSEFRKNITTVNGAWYELKFWLDNDGLGGTQNISPYYPETHEFRVFWGDSLLIDISSYDFDGHYVTATMQAIGSSTILKFSGQETSGYYHIDNISLEQMPVPEPATMLLLGLGLIGLAGFRRRM